MREEKMKYGVASKVVCYQCVHDPFLGRQIRRRGTSSHCSLCDSKRKCVPLDEIVSRVSEILGTYITEGEHVWRWNDGRIDHQEGDSIDYWVSEIFGCDNIEPIVDEVCSRLSSYSDDTNYRRQPFRPNDIGHQWCEFQEGMKHGVRFFNDSAKDFLGWIFKDLDKYSASSDEQAVVRLLTPEDAPPIYRARTCMSFENVAEITGNPAQKLGAPPKERAGEGRMNPAGVPAFYGAFERKTCVAELRPPVGGTVVSGEFRLVREVKVLDFGRFEKADLGPMPSFFDAKYHSKLGRRDFLRYLHDAITVPVLPGAERDYLTTQVIAEYLATHCKPRIDGVIFKSVQESEGSNIVLFSHAACAATSSVGRIPNGYSVRGPRQSDGPCIEYVSDSLVYHGVRQVKYTTDDQQLPEDKSPPMQSPQMLPSGAHTLPEGMEGLFVDGDF
ncbi:RES family NAD+ phosphorylase [Pseudomonas putida]|uniref:RES family NAD+ phosphorylase n=1 Tax=Pseudomonas TaxID=286 RepID=UPI003523CA42